MFIKTQHGFALALLVCAALPPGAHADVDAGLRAFEAGDHAGAMREWLPEAEAGSRVAQFNVGLLHFHGHGVDADRGEAARWYELAADQGFARAQYTLAEMYEAGDGVEADIVRAHMWFNLAGQQRYPDARRRRKRLAKKMTPHQIAYAELHAREWNRKRREADDP